MQPAATATGALRWAPVQRPQALLMAVLAAATLMACLSLSWWGETPLARLLNREAVAAAWPRHLLFVIDWTLMCAAMMLPTALPLLAAMQAACVRQTHPGRLLLVCSLGFMAVWVASGMAVRLLHLGLYTAWFNTPWARGHAAALAGTALLLAGVYLWLPLAQRCVTACRSPRGFVARFWTGRPDHVAQVLRVGLAYGWSCLGCCWPLMLAMSLLGLSDPAWMLAGTVFMALQKQSATGLWLTRALGLVATLAGVALATGWLATPYAAPAWSPEAWAACQAQV